MLGCVCVCGSDARFLYRNKQVNLKKQTPKNILMNKQAQNTFHSKIKQKNKAVN